LENGFSGSEILQEGGRTNKDTESSSSEEYTIVPRGKAEGSSRKNTLSGLGARHDIIQLHYNTGSQVIAIKYLRLMISGLDLLSVEIKCRVGVRQKEKSTSVFFNLR
jgi:hypothetical protein